MRMIKVICAVLALQLLSASPALGSYDWTWPLRGPLLTTYRNGPDPYAAGQHRGVDIGARFGARVVAARAGTVTFAGVVGSAGIVVSQRSADGRFDLSYLHLSSTTVRRGDSVSAGSTLGAVGTSGSRSASAPHLHFGVREAGSPDAYRDPLDFLPAQPPADTPQPRPVPVPVGEPATAEPARAAAPAPAFAPAPGLVAPPVPGFPPVPGLPPLPATAPGARPAPSVETAPGLGPAPGSAAASRTPAAAAAHPGRAAAPGAALAAHGPVRLHDPQWLGRAPTAPGHRTVAAGAAAAPRAATGPHGAHPDPAADRSRPAPPRHRAANRRHGIDLGWLAVCIGLVAAATALGHPDGTRRAAARGRARLATLLRPLARTR